MNQTKLQIVVLAGGVGGAKLAAGLAAIVPPGQLNIIVNTGDDFEHLGLQICPDLDTVFYTLAGLANPETGWGRQGESWRAMGEVAAFGGPEWFKLGDLDLGLHLLRTQWMKEGMSLTAVTERLCQQAHIPHPIWPMSNQPAPTLIETDNGRLPFQTWFVQEKWQPVVKSVVLPEDVRATTQVIRALEKADVVIIAPSNPFVSVRPILNVYPIASLLEDVPQAVIAVSPLIGGQAVKGPAAKMMPELGWPATAKAVAEYYGDLLDGFVYDTADRGTLDGLEAEGLCTQTLMQTPADRSRLAQEVLAFAETLLA